MIKESGNTFKAESLAILFALKKLKEVEITNNKIYILSDNLGLINMINSSNGFIEDEILLEINNLKKKFTNLSFSWLSRKENKIAHNICRNIIKIKSMEVIAKRLKLQVIDNDNFLVQSTNVNNLFYHVSLNTYTCTCRHFGKEKKCKHIIAAQLYKT